MCTPISVTPGQFAPEISWQQAASSTNNGTIVTKSSTNLTVERGSKSLNFTVLSGHTLKYLHVGPEGTVLVLDRETTAPGSYTVHLCDFTGSGAAQLIVQVSPYSTTASDPRVFQSPGTGELFFIIAPSGTLNEFRQLRIVRSLNGADVLSLVGPITITSGPPTAFVDPSRTTVHIHYVDAFGVHDPTGAIPRGVATVTPSSLTITGAVVGAAPALATATGTITIRNTGNDCLIITDIASVAPFALTTASRALLPIDLTPGQQTTLTIQFTATSVGSVSRTLTVATSAGPVTLNVVGQARAPITRAVLSSSAISFGSVRVGLSATGSVSLANAGETPITYNITGPGNPAYALSGTAASGSIAPGGAPVTISVAFSPSAEGNFPDAVTVSSPGFTSAQSISLSGSGCVPNAAIQTPPSPLTPIGNVERGFRTVRMVRINNTGDAPLTFNASYSGPDAGLFSVRKLDGTIAASAAFEVLPPTSCGGGATGPGFVDFAIEFYANRPTSGVASADLVIAGHNATNAPANISLSIQATITDPVALDAVLVVDHSGSMADPFGSRQKVDAAVGGAQLFFQLLRADLEDRVAFVRFSTVPSVVQGMVSVSSSTPPTQASIVAMANPSTLQPTAATAIAAGMSVGLDQFNVPRTPTTQPVRKAMVVLTDGLDNTAYQRPSDGQWISLRGGPSSDPTTGASVNTIEIGAMPAGVKVYGIGLGTGPNIDGAALNAITTGTGGYYAGISDANSTQFFQTEKYYTQIFMDAVDLSAVSDPVYGIQVGQEHNIEFEVLAGDTLALVVIYDKDYMRLPFSLLSPRGQLIDGASIPPEFQVRSREASSARFVEVHMPTGKPELYQGTWKVIVRCPDEVCATPPPRPSDARTAKDITLDRTGNVSSRCEKHVKIQGETLYGIAIGVGSDFRMQPYVYPGPVYVGEPVALAAGVAEAGLAVSGCVVEVTCRSPSGFTQSLVLPESGVSGEYTGTFTHTDVPGYFEFIFRAVGRTRDGKPIVREVARPKYVQSKTPDHTQDPQNPGGTGENPGGTSDECCLRLLKVETAQLAILKRLEAILLRTKPQPPIKPKPAPKRKASTKKRPK